MTYRKSPYPSLIKANRQPERLTRDPPKPPILETTPTNPS
jgi:hypothetical protein